MSLRFRGWVKPVGVDNWVEMVQGSNVSQALQKLKALPYEEGDWQISTSDPVPLGMIELVLPKPLVGNFEEFTDVRNASSSFSCTCPGAQPWNTDFKEGLPRFAACE